jgi:hypothetical protein
MIAGHFRFLHALAVPPAGAPMRDLAVAQQVARE